jgi:hypothetical protein
MVGAAACASDDADDGSSGAGGASGPGAFRDSTVAIGADAAPPIIGEAGADSGSVLDQGLPGDATPDATVARDTGGRPDAAADAASACPFNSGWPCACGGVTVCDNGDICFGLGPGEGLCSRRCAGVGDDAPCTDAMGWGIEGGGRCAYEVTFEGETFGVCALVCQVQAQNGELVKGDCPPGARCVPQSGFSACFAEPSAR